MAKLVCEVSKPRNFDHFIDLMSLYEQNYLQLRLLAPKVRHLDAQEYVSTIDVGLPLYLQVIEQQKYTTTINLSFRFISKNRYPKQPDLLIRVYHDAQSAEVLSGLVHGQRYVRRKARGLKTSLESNRFLYKWLRYCLHQGHSFKR